MSDYTLLVEDLHALERALRQAGHSCTLAADGALVVTCSLAETRRVARVAGIAIRQQWPPSFRLPVRPAGSPPADTTAKEHTL
jgi:hypothetical protein